MKWKPDWSDIAENLLTGLMAVAAAAIYNDMSYRRRPASEILWAMVKANGKRTN